MMIILLFLLKGCTRFLGVFFFLFAKNVMDWLLDVLCPIFPKILNIVRLLFINAWEIVRVSVKPRHVHNVTNTHNEHQINHNHIHMYKPTAFFFSLKFFIYFSNLQTTPVINRNEIVQIEKYKGILHNLTIFKPIPFEMDISAWKISSELWEKILKFLNSSLYACGQLTGARGKFVLKSIRWIWR